MCQPLQPGVGGSRLIPAMLWHLCSTNTRANRIESSPGCLLTCPGPQQAGSELVRVSQGGDNSAPWSLPHGLVSTGPWRTVFPRCGTSRDCSVPTWPCVKPRRQRREVQVVDSWLACLRSCWKVLLCSVGQVASVGVLFPGRSDEAGDSPLSACQVRFALHAQAAVRTSLDWHLHLADPAHHGGEEPLASCVCLYLICKCQSTKPPVSPWQAGRIVCCWLAMHFPEEQGCVCSNPGLVLPGNELFSCLRCCPTWLLITNS